MEGIDQYRDCISPPGEIRLPTMMRHSSTLWYSPIMTSSWLMLTSYGQWSWRKVCSQLKWITPYVMHMKPTQFEVEVGLIILSWIWTVSTVLRKPWWQRLCMEVRRDPGRMLINSPWEALPVLQKGSHPQLQRNVNLPQWEFWGHRKCLWGLSSISSKSRSTRA